MLATRGLDPAHVAKLVLEAVRDQRFWILPHPGWIDVLRERVEGMAANGELRGGFSG